MALLIALGGLALTALPVAFANPINANLNWSPNPITTGSTTTATYGVAIDQDCPSGATFTGTLTVLTPTAGSASVTVGTTPCGTTTLSAVYPTAFTGTASTTACGVYSATWAGTTSALVGGVHPTFNVTDNFIVTCPTSAPEFGAPAMLVAAIGLVAFATMRRGRLLKV